MSELCFITCTFNFKAVCVCVSDGADVNGCVQWWHTPKAQLGSLPPTCEKLPVSPPSYVRYRLPADRTLDVNIGPDHGHLVLRRLRQPLWRLCENKCQHNRRDHTKVRSHQRTFHHHVKVVDDVSSRVLGLAHVLPSIAVLHFRQDQKPTEVVIFCPRRQLLSHFHPLDFWSGTTTRNTVISYCQTNYATVSGGKKPNLYIQSPRYTLQLQKLSSQHHLLCLDTRGQQHAGHSHWGGFRRWEGNNHHII